MSINIDSLTIAEAREIASMFAQMTAQKVSRITDNLIGKYVIVRSRNEGINAGHVEAADETGIVLRNARRLWYHKPAVNTESWYEGVANHGLSADSKISAPVATKAIIEDYSVTLCTDKAQQSIEGAPSHAQR
jgi:hypothetical protein